MAKNYVVVAIGEEGNASVYGPYKKKKAEDVSEAIYMDDSAQKVLVNVEKLYKYESEQLDSSDDYNEEQFKAFQN